MRPRRLAALVALALLVTCLDGGSAEQETKPAAPAQGARIRVLRKAARELRRGAAAAGGARRGRDLIRGSELGVDGRDERYLANQERAFRGDSYRQLDDRDLADYSGRGLSDTSARGFASESRNYDTNRNEAFETDRALGSFRKPYAKADEDSDFLSNTDKNVGSSSRDFGSAGSEYAAPRGGGASRGPAPVRLGDYSREARDRSDSQRWLKILAEFLKSSSEGRELLRARADQLLVGADVNAGELPLPLLLVPVPVEDQQCAAPKAGSPQSELQPPSYLPPNKTNESPITPKELRPSPRVDEEYRRLLLALFRSARPRAPQLPPLLLPESPPPARAAPLPPLSAAPPPARLSFPRSLLIRAELTAYYSDYTEPYTVWYDAETGASRVDMHGGTTVLYRSVQPGGDVQRVQFRIERFGEEEQRRCTRLTTSAARADLAPPGLPDTEPFRFDGYQQTEAGRLERWTHSVAGQAGELGAARGEALVFRHELLVARLQADVASPVAYRVSVDSSLLGAAADWYEHRYLEVREQRPDASYMSIDLTRECDVLERAQRLEHVDPLREFVMMHRDSRCDTDFEKFKEVYEVNYEDPYEDAVRKTLLIWSTRFVESANRQGASAEMAVNELSVLLPAEKRLLLGLVDDDGDGDGDGDSGGDGDAPGEVGASPFRFGARGGGPRPTAFPLAADEVARLAKDLPPAFSWKRKGAVTHIRNQGFCKTCWAFAVVASVEGALFLRTGKLVPLSEQQLADCSAGPHTCQKGNHVRYPYERVRQAGLAALDDYPRYDFTDPKIAQCRKEDSPVTKISGFVEVPDDADALKVSIFKHGPNVVEVDSACDGFMYFKAGVLIDKRCNPKARNHAVTAVAFGRHKTYGDYFVVKNSWGLSGNRGYVHLHARTNTAGVHTAPSYPLLGDDDVRRLPASSRTFPDEKSLFKIDGKAGYTDFLRRQKKYQDEKKSQARSKRPTPRA